MNIKRFEKRSKTIIFLKVIFSDIFNVMKFKMLNLSNLTQLFVDFQSPKTTKQTGQFLNFQKCQTPENIT